MNVGAFIRLGSNYPLSAPVFVVVRCWGRGGTWQGSAGMGGLRHGRAARHVRRRSGGLGHGGRKPKPRHVSRRAACHRPAGTDPNAPTGLHVVAQAHGRAEPMPRDSGLGVVGEQDGLAPAGLRSATASEYLRLGQEKRPSVYESCTRRALASESLMSIGVL